MTEEEKTILAEKRRLDEIDFTTRTLKESLDRHLEIYANNGVALKKMATIVEKVDTKIENYHTEARGIAEDLSKKVDKIMVDVAPLVELSKNATGASKFINWIFAQWKWVAIIVVLGWITVKSILKQL